MKILHEQIEFARHETVHVKMQEAPHFTYPWHFHPEYEILYVIDGFGTSFVADNIEEFSSGDLAMLGTNLPHFWKSDMSFHDPDNQIKIKYIVIQFSQIFFREAMINYPEFQSINTLLHRSSKGIRFEKAFAEKIGRKIIKISKSSGLKRILLLLELLQLLAKTEDYRLLAGEMYQAENHNFGSDRLTKVMHYLNTCYLKKVELEKVAEVANLHPAAFCRYFKEKSGKSLSEFVNDKRISYACQLLIDGKLSVSQICYESGFNNLSNFNRLFKRSTGFTPSQYSKEFHMY